MGFNAVNLSDKIQRSIDQVPTSSSDLKQIADNVGTYKIRFLIEDPRVLENTTWRSVLSNYQEFDIEVIKTLPEISFNTPETYRLADPEDEFLQWEKNITVIDAKGNSLPLVQDPNEQDAASAEGYFYYDPLPNVNVKGQSDFKIVAVDWRGVTNSSASIPFVVEANLPEVTNDPTFLRPEMSDELLSEVEHNITAEDEFENIFGDLTINLKRVLDLDRSEVTLPDNPRLSDLRDQIYIFEYNVSDFRGESILVERELRVNVTPPDCVLIRICFK